MSLLGPNEIINSWLNIDPSKKFNIQFASNVLGEEQKCSFITQEVSQRVNIIIRDFLINHESQFNHKHHASLKNLLSYVHRFKKETSLYHHRSQRPTSLEKRIASAIKLSKQNDILSVLPSPLMEICDQYRSIEDCIYLHMLGRSPSKSVFNQLFSAEEAIHIDNFALTITEKYDKDPKTVKK